MGNAVHSKNEKVGFRVVKIVDDSPGHRCGLVENSDIILSVNNLLLHSMSKISIIELVKASEDKVLALEVFDEVTKSKRNVDIIPTKKWNGEGLLGIIIRLEVYEGDKNDSVEETDIGFDAIYGSPDDDEEQRPKDAPPVEKTSKLRRASSMLKRLSFSSEVLESSNCGNKLDEGSSPNSSSSATGGNGSAGIADQQHSPASTSSEGARRPSTAGRLFRAMGGGKDGSSGIVDSSSHSTPSTTDSTDLSAGGITEGHADAAQQQQSKSRTGSIFRKMSFTTKGQGSSSST